MNKGSLRGGKSVFGMELLTELRARQVLLVSLFDFKGFTGHPQNRLFKNGDALLSRQAIVLLHLKN